jgi:hypothetical protein
MKYQYVVILRKSGEGAVNLLSILLCFTSVIIFIRTALMTGNPGYPFYILAALIFAGLAFNAVAARRHTKPVGYKYLLLLTGLGWLTMPISPWIGLVFGALAFLEHQTKRPLEIGFDHDRVVINTLIRQRHDWSAFNNVVLRNGLLTLDFKSNRLLQREVADDDDDDNADEEEFNGYCRECLAAQSRTQYGK